MSGRYLLTRTELAIKVGSLRYRFSMAEIADRLGVCLRTVYNWWGGEKMPHKCNKKRLLRLYNYWLCKHAGDRRTPKRGASAELNPDKTGGNHGP